MDIFKTAKNTSIELYEQMENFPADEFSNIPEQFLADELSWLLRKYRCSEYRQSRELLEAQLVMKETQYGKLPVLLFTGQLKYSYREIEFAKSVVEEYRSLCRLEKKLKEMGYVGAHKE